jgi:HEPN domain-containing protein
MASDRATFQRLAGLRLKEAKLLARESEPSGAYYLAGYAIECALKARISRQFRENEIPNRALVNRIHTHDIAELLRLAGLESELDIALGDDAELDRRWSIVKSWNEQARYEIWTHEDASAMIDAVDGDGLAKGLLQWLTAHW